MKTEKWLTACCSIVGASHKRIGLPCQDSSKFHYIKNSNFIIAVVSDGAGSCVNSQIGSQFLVDNVIKKIINSYNYNKWGIKDNIKLLKENWRKKSYFIFKKLKKDLLKKAEKENIDFKSLSATLIVTISNGEFIACANIGDGRAAFRNKEGDWMPMMVPTRGEEANQTIFITSGLWDKKNQEEYFGTFFYENPITAFSLLTDGCERASFEVNIFNEKEGKYFDPNTPFKPFFEPNYNTLLELKNENIKQKELNEMWRQYIENGNEVLKNEYDDKTMILSVIINQ